MELPPYTLSRRAPSTARPPLRRRHSGRRELEIAKRPAARNAGPLFWADGVVPPRLPSAAGDGLDCSAATLLSPVSGVGRGHRGTALQMVAQVRTVAFHGVEVIDVETR